LSGSAALRTPSSAACRPFSCFPLQENWLASVSRTHRLESSNVHLLCLGQHGFPVIRRQRPIDLSLIASQFLSEKSSWWGSGTTLLDNPSSSQTQLFGQKATTFVAPPDTCNTVVVHALHSLVYWRWLVSDLLHPLNMHHSLASPFWCEGCSCAFSFSSAFDPSRGFPAFFDEKFFRGVTASPLFCLCLSPTN